MAPGVFDLWVCKQKFSPALTSADVLIAQTDHIFAEFSSFSLPFIPDFFYLFTCLVLVMVKNDKIVVPSPCETRPY